MLNKLKSLKGYSLLSKYREFFYFVFLIIIIIACSAKSKNSNSIINIDFDSTKSIHLLTTSENYFSSNPGFSTEGKIKVVGYRPGDPVHLYNNADCSSTPIDSIYTDYGEETTFFDVHFTNGLNEFSVKKFDKNSNEVCLTKVSYTKAYINQPIVLTSKSGDLTATWNYPEFIDDRATIDFKITVNPGNIEVTKTSIKTITFKDLEAGTYYVKIIVTDKDEQTVKNSSDLKKVHNPNSFQLITGNGPICRIVKDLDNDPFENMHSACDVTDIATYMSLVKNNKIIYSWGSNSAASGSNVDMLTVKISTTTFASLDANTGEIASSLGTGAPGENYISIAGSPDFGSTQSFAALNEDGRIYEWNASSGDYISEENFSAVIGNYTSFAALTKDNTIYAWGNPSTGGINDYISGEDYIAIASNYGAFAALKKNGSIYSWGDSVHGALNNLVPGNDYIAIATTYYNFAGLKRNGSIYNWGSNNISIIAPNKKFISITSNDGSFAALTEDGSIYSWGLSCGVTMTPRLIEGDFRSIATSWQQIGTDCAFSALRNNGTIYTWGDTSCGGNKGDFNPFEP